DGVADQRTKAFIMANYVTEQQDAIQLLEDVNRSQPLSAEERFLLAKLYEATNNRSKLKVNMLTLLASREGKKPDYYAYYVRHLLRIGKLAEAQAWHKKLEALAPESNVAKEIRARILDIQGKQGQAAALLKDFAAVKEENLSMAALLLDELA